MKGISKRMIKQTNMKRWARLVCGVLPVLVVSTLLLKFISVTKVVVLRPKNPQNKTFQMVKEEKEKNTCVGLFCF